LGGHEFFHARLAAPYLTRRGCSERSSIAGRFAAIVRTESAVKGALAGSLLLRHVIHHRTNLGGSKSLLCSYPKSQADNSKRQKSRRGYLNSP